MREIVRKRFIVVVLSQISFLNNSMHEQNKLVEDRYVQGNPNIATNLEPK